MYRKDRFRVRSDDGASSDVRGDRGRLVGGKCLPYLDQLGLYIHTARPRVGPLKLEVSLRVDVDQYESFDIIAKAQAKNRFGVY